MMELSLFDRVGGSAAIHAIVERLFQKMLADPNLCHEFLSNDVSYKKHKLEEYLSVLFCSTLDSENSLKSFSSLATLLDLCQSNDAVVEDHLSAVLKELNVPHDFAEEVKAITHHSDQHKAA